MAQHGTFPCPFLNSLTMGGASMGAWYSIRNVGGLPKRTVERSKYEGLNYPSWWRSHTGELLLFALNRACDLLPFVCVIYMK